MAPDRVPIAGPPTVEAPAALATALWPEGRFGPLLGDSAAMRLLFAGLARVAARDGTVLLQGETGTGKELAARAIHEASPRAAGPFVVVDCGALPDTLLESELFGHRRGAFTGATDSHEGAIESAEGGTVFLDEIGDLPPAMQPKLLRVLESRTIRRVGEPRHRPVNVRFISATNRDLAEMTRTGGFREDLYFRLAVLPLRVPPLRERREDIPALLTRFVPEICARLDPATLDDLLAWPWPGNVRELRNFAERLVAFGPGAARTAEGARPASARSPLPYHRARERAIDEFEHRYVHALLAAHQDNVAEAARAARMDRAYLYRLIRRHAR
jgi:two-component system response regulator GlrR